MLLSVQAPGLNFTFAHYRPDTRELATVETSTGKVWRLDTDFDRVVHTTCARPLSVDWPAHFPGVTPPHLCP